MPERENLGDPKHNGDLVEDGINSGLKADEDFNSEVRSFSDRHGVNLTVAERIIGVATNPPKVIGVRYKSEHR